MVVDRERGAPAHRSLAEWKLLVVGVFLLVLPLVVVIAAPTTLIDAQLYLRIIAAIGGALIGGFIPGALQITLPGIKGVGALGIFALIYAVNPPVVAAASANPPSSVAKTTFAASSTSERLSKWIFLNTAPDTPSRVNVAHYQALQNWMSTSSEYTNIPVALLVAGDTPTLEQGRQAAIRDLNIP